MVVCHDKTVQKSYEKVLHSGDYVSLKYVKSCYVGSAGLEQGRYRDLQRAFQFVLCNTSIFVAIGVGLIFH